MYNREVLFKVNEALQQKYAGRTFISNGCNSIVKVPGRSKGSSRATFQFNPSRTIDWLDSESELMRLARVCYDCPGDVIEKLEVELALEYIETTGQQAPRPSGRSSIMT